MRTKDVTRTDAVLHPTRLQIIRALGRGHATPSELLAATESTPQASLYRHLSHLLEAGIIQVVDERKVRGVVERTYGLVPGAAVLTAEDVAHANADDHYRYFSVFVAGLLGQFARYLEQGDIDLGRDGVGYRELVLNLSDAEFDAFIAGFQELVRPLIANKPGADRRARVLATVLFPLDSPVR
ncbi:MAG: helix-turn-helix domain-containing protein [Telluria sp.]